MAAPEPLKLTGEVWRRLCEVNAEVNGDVRYRTDVDLYDKPDFWEIASGEGDCEDIQLRKRERLRQQGLPEAAMRLAVCTYHGEGHAVLTIDTDAGCWVLDNRYALPQAWAVLPYTWLKREAPAGQGWVEIPAE